MDSIFAGLHDILESQGSRSCLFHLVLIRDDFEVRVVLMRCGIIYKFVCE